MVEDGKVAVAAGVTKAESTRFRAGALVVEVAAMLGGKGGGRPDMAQGGDRCFRLDTNGAVIASPDWVRQQNRTSVQDGRLACISDCSKVWWYLS